MRGGPAGVSESLGQPWLRGACRRALERVAVLLLAAAPLAFPGVAPAAGLSVVPNGEPGATVTVEARGVTNPPCTAIAIKVTECTYTYPVGELVTLTATADQFSGWSDVRCPPVPTCTVSLDEESSTIAASYALQRLWVRITGAGTVAPIGSPSCAVDPNDPTTADCGLFALGSRVTLRATPANAPGPRWQRALSAAERPLCDDLPGADTAGDQTCPIDMNGLRWGNVAFDDQPFSPAVPASVSVNFRIIKVGNGAGTVRSRSLDCGSRCTVRRTFGNAETLEAVPSRGSRFVRWRGACASAPTCSLAVGPVTALSAEFQTSDRSSPATPRTGRLVARIARVSVRGRGRGRTVSIRMQANADATARAALLRGRRTVVSRSRRTPAGGSVIALRVPRRARPGVYRVRVTVRDRAGQAVTAARRVRLRR
jgi:hypothetical protein